MKAVRKLLAQVAALPSAEEIARRFAEQHAYLGTLRIARICKEQVTARLGEGWAK